MNDKDLEAFDEWREAARSEAEEVNRLQTENTNLKEQDKIISNEIKTYIEIGRKLQAQNKKLREALEYYANYDNWKFEDVAACVIWMDSEPYPSHINGKAIRGFEELRVSGKRAREALKEITTN
jgi:hypothetical protein